MKIYCFYKRIKVCFPHVWELVMERWKTPKKKYEVYQCSICGKKKEKRVNAFIK